MKILVIGDLHFKVNNIPETDLLIQKVLNLLRQQTFQFILLLGDTLDSHERMHMVPYNKAINFITKIAELFPVYVLIGNHDRLSNKEYMTEEHPFVCLKNIKNINIIYKAELFNIEEKKFIFVPYVPVGQFNNALQTLNLTNENSPDIDLKDITAVFSHQEFKGCNLGNKVSEHGDSWPLHYPLNISGHIHMYQKLQPNLIYVGTPFQQTFKETEDKTISIFEFKDNIAMNGVKTNEYNETRLNLQLPKKITIEINSNQINEIKIPVDCKVRLIINATASEIKTLIKSSKIVEWEKEGIKIKYKTVMEVNDEKNDIQLKKQYTNYTDALMEKVSKRSELMSLLKEIL
jgi:predicted phosphodiesterase